MLFNRNFIFFSFLYQFSMLFNRNFAFLQFSMLFNGNMRLRGFGGGGCTDGRTDAWKFTPVSYRTSALWGRCPKRNLNYSYIPSYNTREYPSIKRFFHVKFEESYMLTKIETPSLQQKNHWPFDFRYRGVRQYLKTSYI